MRTAVLALGGNALARAGERATITNQFRHARESVAPIVQLAKDGWGIAIVHGNGPQVGDELVRNEVARKLVEPLPLGVLVANTAGWIGYMLQQSLQNALRFGQVGTATVTLVAAAAGRWLEEIAQLTVAAIVWSGARLKIIPYGDRPLAANGATWTPDLTWQYSLGDADFIDFGGRSDPVQLIRADPAQAPSGVSAK